jgi:hypothetical protein
VGIDRVGLLELVGRFENFRLGDQPAAPDRRSEHDGGADQDGILDDVLSLERWGVRYAGKHFRREKYQRRQRSDHLQAKK